MPIGCSEVVAPSPTVELRLTVERPVGDSVVRLPTLEGLLAGDILNAEFLIVNLGSEVLSVGEYGITARRLRSAAGTRVSGPSHDENVVFDPPMAIAPQDSFVVTWTHTISHCSIHIRKPPGESPTNDSLTRVTTPMRKPAVTTFG